MTSIQARWTAALGAAALLALSAAAAHAAPAYVKSTVNLRTAPGTDQAILGKIPAGSLVDATTATAAGARSTGRARAATQS